MSGLRASGAREYLENLTWLTMYFQAIVMLGSNDYPAFYRGDVEKLALQTFQHLVDVVRFMKQNVVGLTYIVLPPPRPCSHTWPKYHLFLRSLDALLRERQSQEAFVYLGFSPLLFEVDFKPKKGVLFKKADGEMDIHLSTSGYLLFSRWLSDVFSHGKNKPSSTKRRLKQK